MIELKCQNCGSFDMVLKNGIYYCQSCGSRFLMEREKPDKVEKYRDKMIDAMQESLGETEKVSKYIDKLLSIDPDDPYAWTGKVWWYIEHGLDDYSKECVLAAKHALVSAHQTATEEELEDIKDFMRTHFRLYGDKMKQKAPSMIKEINWIIQDAGAEY